jgi:hypothetical protein
MSTDIGTGQKARHKLEKGRLRPRHKETKTNKRKVRKETERQRPYNKNDAKRTESIDLGTRGEEQEAKN